jgi:Big-like domain-containing protein
MTVTLRYSVLAVVVALCAACDKVPLLAPNGSSINLSANSLIVPTNGTTGLTAFVTESSGTPVQNGTTVRFTTTLGTVSPAEVQTTNGIAVATFQAGASSGIAEVHAVSGGATGSTTSSGSTTTSSTNVVKISVGAAAVNTITLRANPSSVGPNGGSVELVASVTTENGGPVQSVPVTFNADQGTLTVQTVPTDVNGEARTVLTTSQKTSVTASAGTKTSTPAVVVDVRAGPGVTITCAPAGGAAGASCANLQASASNNTATVTFTVTKGTGTSNLRDATIDFGDGTSQGLGTLAGGAVTVTHAYAGPSGSSPRGYTATVRATDVNNETTNVSTSITITPRGPFTVDLTASPGDSNSHPVTETLTATVAGGDAARFDWDFEGDGTVDATTTSNKTTHVYGNANQYTAIVTVTSSDGRTGTGRVEFNVK